MRYFIAVAERLHFGEAARALNTAQPSLSQQIRKLEAELGVELFERDRHNVRLTAAGTAFLDDARSIVARAARSIVTAREAAAGRLGCLRFACSFGTATDAFSDVLRGFGNENPDIALEIRTSNACEAGRALADERVDVALFRTDSEEPGLAKVGLARERLILAIPESHPLARTHDESLPLAALRSQRILVPERGAEPGLHDAAREAVARADVEIANVAEVEDPQALVALAAAGFGIGIVPHTWYDATSLRLRAYDLETAHTIEVAFHYRTDLGNPLLASFVEFLARRDRA